MKIIYQDNSLKKIRKLRKVAFDLREKFHLKSPVEVLQMKFEVLEEIYDELILEISNEFIPKGKLSRHISWIGTYLKDNQPSNCLSDVESICDYDIDDFEDSYVEFQRSRFVNKELSENVIALLAEENNDSAVRKAFVILSENLRNKFEINEGKDGRELVNEIFGKNGKSNIELAKGEKDALRELLSGMYGFFRNPYAHNSQEEWSMEADVIVGLVNIILNFLDNKSETTT